LYDDARRAKAKFRNENISDARRLSH